MHNDNNIDYSTPEKAEALQQLKEVIGQSLPEGFRRSETADGFSYCVPHELYPGGYHCNPAQPLPFLSVKIQKNFVALYHMGLYADAELLNWFVAEYPRHARYKLDMGKSCIRFKKTEDIPYGLIGELATKMSVADWIDCYETQLKIYKK